MIGNFFKSIFDAIAGVAEGIFSVFATVVEAVAGLAILPFASLFGAIINVASNGLCELMQLIAAGTIGLFAIDIGTGNSVFEVVIGGMDWIWPAMRLMGLALVFFIFITNILKIMTTHNSNETPQSLLASTVAAGICVAAGPIVVMQFVKMFNAFFEFVLGVHDIGQLDFTNFATAAQLYVQGGEINVELGAQLASVVTAFLYLFLLLMIVGKFVSFMLEVSQRYVVLGALLVTSPVAFALFTSKSTRSSFSSWVRMVGSQLFLMVTNALFLSLFFTAFGSFTTTLDTMQDAEIAAGVAPLVVVILWCLLLYSILYVGAKFDTYLGTLGLSTAETGGSMLTQVAAELFDMGAFQGFLTGKSDGHHKAGEDGEPAPRGVAGMVDRAQRAMGVGRHRPEKGKNIIQLDQTNSATPESISKAVKSMAASDSISGAQVGRGVISGVKGLPSKVKGRLNPNSCRVSAGAIKMDSFTDTQGKGFSVSFIPKADVEAKGTVMGCGRTVSIGGVDYVAFATGSDARAFNVANSGVKKAMAETYGPGVVQQVFNDKQPTGIYQREERGPQGAVVHQWAPTSCYQADPALSPSVVHIGSLDYWSYDVPLPETTSMPDEGGYCDMPHMPPEPADRVDWMSTQFPQSQAAGYTPVRQEGGITYMERDGREFAMAPTAVYESVPTPGEAEGPGQQVWTAANGALYTVVEVKQDAAQGEPFTRRDAKDGPQFVREIDFTDQFSNDTGKEAELTQAQVEEIIRAAAPEIVKAAMEKAKDEGGE